MTYEIVLVLLIMGHDERATEAVEHLERLAVFRILFGDFLGEKLAHGCLQTHAECFHAAKQSFDIIVLIIHNAEK